MNHKLDASEQRQLLGELQSLRSMLESSGSADPALNRASAVSELTAALATPSEATGATSATAPALAAQCRPNEPPLLDDVVSFENSTARPDPVAIETSWLESTHADGLPAENSHAEISHADAAATEGVLELQFGLDDPDWSQFVDQVFSQHGDLAVDHNGRAGGAARDPEQSRDALLLEELTRKLDARLAKLRQTLLMEIKGMLQRRGRLR